MKNTRFEIKKYGPVVEKIWCSFVLFAFVAGYILI